MLNTKLKVTQKTYNTAWFELDLHNYRPVLSGATFHIQT